MITRKRFNLNKSSQKIVITSSYLVVARVGKKFFWIFDPGNSRPAPDRNTSQNEVPTKKTPGLSAGGEMWWVGACEGKHFHNKKMHFCVNFILVNNTTPQASPFYKQGLLFSELV